MSHKHFTWDQTFRELFERSLERYNGGDSNLDNYYTTDDLMFLAAIGYKPREFFDYVEDYGDAQTPSVEAAILIAAVRRDYFLTIQKGQASTEEMKPNELPGRNEELAGHPWLPRIIQKARNKLRGENDPDIMFSCGGDRRFLTQYDIHPADFLRVVWAAGDNDQYIVDYVNQRSAGKG